MFGNTSLLTTTAAFIFCVSFALMFYGCFILVSWANPFRWVAMWFVLLTLGFIAGSVSGPIAYGHMGGSPSKHLWGPSLGIFGMAIAIASAGTIGVWRSNRDS